MNLRPNASIRHVPTSARAPGCQWQHVSYDAQLRYKFDAVTDALKRVGGFANPSVAPTIPSPDQLGYRNHARFTVGEEGSLGFVNRETRRHVTVDKCMLMDPGVNDILSKLQDRCAETTQLSVRWGVNTGDYLVQPTLKSPDIPVTTGQKRYVETLGDCSFQIASPSFFQVNIKQLERLVDLVKDGLQLSGDETLVDAYAGVGTFALLLAPYARRIIAIEDSPAAVEDAKANAAGLSNVEFLQGRTEEALPNLQVHPDGVILDPSRKGCHPSALKALKELKPARVVYVSCDPSTLARDLKILCKDVFFLEGVTPVDMFPQTHHVECIAVLTLRRPLEGLMLASSSPRRRLLMTSLGVPFEATTPDVEEQTEDGESPEDTVRRLALAKAQASAQRHPGRLVVGADTLVVSQGRVLGKPADAAQARQMLTSLRGRVHRVITGVAVVDGAAGQWRLDVCESEVLMRNYSASEIDQYVASGRASDKAGGLRCSGPEPEPGVAGGRVPRQRGGPAPLHHGPTAERVGIQRRIPVAIRRMPAASSQTGETQMNFFGIGGMELLVVVFLAFIILGPRQLTSVAKGLGRMIRELRNATTQFSHLMDEDDEVGKGQPPKSKNQP